jgi:TPR repeat protein
MDSEMTRPSIQKRDVRIRQAQHRLTMDDLDGAADCLVRIADPQGLSADLLYEIGRSYSRHGHGVGKAISWFRKAAEAGHVEACMAMARCYHGTWETMANDLRQAMKWYGKAAESGDPVAMEAIAEIYEVGDGDVLPDRKRARAWTQKALAAKKKKVAQDDIDTIAALAWEQRRSDCLISKEEINAEKHLHQLANTGNIRAMLKLGELDLPSRTIKSLRPSKDLAWFKKAAEMGSPEAMRQLVLLCGGQRKCIAPDAEQANFWQRRWLSHWRQKADTGEPFAMLQMANALLTPIAPRSGSYPQALIWLRRAVKADYTAAMMLLSKISIGRSPYKDTPVKDASLAVKLYRRAFTLGNLNAGHHLAELFKNGGPNLSKDQHQAGLWLKKAHADLFSRAAAGSAQAMVQIAAYYDLGIFGFEKSDTQIAAWLKKAAHQDDTYAMCQLAMRYETGWEGAAADGLKAMYWYTQAAQRGHAKAYHAIGRLYENGAPNVAADIQKALACYKKAAELGNAAAMQAISIFYLMGNGVPEDHDKAEQWNQKAIRYGGGAKTVCNS